MRFRVDREQNSPSRKAIESMEELLGNPKSIRADWIGVQPVDLTRQVRFPHFRQARGTRLDYMGILYHTIDYDGSPFGRGYHQRYLEALGIQREKKGIDSEPTRSTDPTRNLDGIQAILSAQLRVEYLAKKLPDREIQLSAGISLYAPETAGSAADRLLGRSTLAIPGDEPLPEEDLAFARLVSSEEGIKPIPVLAAD